MMPDELDNNNEEWALGAHETMEGPIADLHKMLEALLPNDLDYEAARFALQEVADMTHELVALATEERDEYMRQLSQLEEEVENSLSDDPRIVKLRKAIKKQAEDEVYQDAWERGYEAAKADEDFSALFDMPTEENQDD